MLTMKLICIFARDLTMRHRFPDLQVDEVVNSIDLVNLLIVPNICLDEDVTAIRFKSEGFAHASFVANAKEGVRMGSLLAFLRLQQNRIL